MTLKLACIAPHGGEVIPSLASRSDSQKFSATTAGMKFLARKVKSSSPDTILIASPHNLRVQGKIAIVTTENSEGILKGNNGRSVSLQAKCDVEFATTLYNESTKRGLPVVAVNYGTASGPASNMPMDWGTLVPLWFFLKTRMKRPRIVIMAPSREILLRENYRFGKLLGQLIRRNRSKRFVFVASADQAHAHKTSGPYGFHPAAAKYDQIVVNAVKSNRLGLLLNLKSRFVENAKPDSLWQIAILAGVTDAIPCASQLVSYQVPTYYGMICALFNPTG